MMLKRALPLAAGLAVIIGLFGPVGGAEGSSATPHAVPLDCSSDGGDQRTAYDASVQPGVIVPDFDGWPYSPVTYTAYGFDRQTGEPMLIGNTNEIGTTDHLVAAWEDSTNCFGPAGDEDISRNAWVADASGHVFGESDLSGPPANNFGDAVRAGPSTSRSSA